MCTYACVCVCAQTEFTNILIDGCLFEKCYASNKGGGMHQGVGQITVLDSVFFNNTAGSNNAEAGEGRGRVFSRSPPGVL